MDTLSGVFGEEIIKKILSVCYYNCSVERTCSHWYNLMKGLNLKWEPIHRQACTAARLGHTSLLQYILKEYEDVVCGDVQLVQEMGESAASEGQIECLRYLVNNINITICNKHTPPNHKSKYNNNKQRAINASNPLSLLWSSVSVVAAKNGYLNILEYAFEQKLGMDILTCRSAAENGNLECLKFAHERGGCPLIDINNYYNNIANFAASGNLECLKYVHERGSDWNEKAWENAALKGNLDCLEYLYRTETVNNNGNRDNIVGDGNGNRNGNNRCCWNEGICHAASGNLECLKFLHENGCPWNYSTIIGAAELQNIDCIKYAHERGCPWNENASRNASESGRVELLQYVHENGCPWNGETTSFAGSLECLKYAIENGCPIPSDTCTSIAKLGNIEMMKYAHEKGAKWGPVVSFTAAENGHLYLLKYLHENGCEWDSRTCSAAARRGHLECLKYARENGCEWDHKTCIEAARGGHLIILKYAVENGCKLNKLVCEISATVGSLKCLKYARESGCEWDFMTVQCAIINEKWKCLKYAFENKCKGAETSMIHLYGKEFSGSAQPVILDKTKDDRSKKESELEMISGNGNY